MLSNVLKSGFYSVPDLAQKRFNRVYWAVQPGVPGGLTGSTGRFYRYNRPV
ncbi:hypothetical protein Hanom_Chr13g01222691 [Helianthus anomalus]